MRPRISKPFVQPSYNYLSSRHGDRRHGPGDRRRGPGDRRWGPGNRRGQEGDPIDRQRDLSRGLGIMALTPTPRAVIPGTEGKTGTRKRIRDRGYRRLRTDRVQREVP